MMIDNCKIWKLTELNFLTKFIFAQKWSKWLKNGKKSGFFNISEKFCYDVFLDLVLSKCSNYQICACTDTIPWKILVLELWVKILSLNEIARCLNQQYFKKKIDKSTWFLARWYRFKKHEGCFVNFYFGVVEYLN